MREYLKLDQPDKLNKLSLCRAIGKRKELNNRKFKLINSIDIMDINGLLTYDLLLKTTQILINYSIEIAKLDLLIKVRKNNSEKLTEYDILNAIDMTVNCYRLYANVNYNIYKKFSRELIIDSDKYYTSHLISQKRKYKLLKINEKYD